MEVIRIKTNKREELISITGLIQEIINKNNYTDGVIFLYVPHTTAGITINEDADLDVKSDIVNYLKKLIPQNANFEHMEGNSDAHIKSSIIGNSLNIIVENGRLVLGRWQGIFFAEFDGPRTREVWIKFINSKS